MTRVWNGESDSWCNLTFVWPGFHLPGWLGIGYQLTCRRDLSDRRRLTNQCAQTRHTTLLTAIFIRFPPSPPPPLFFGELSLSDGVRVTVHEWKTFQTQGSATVLSDLMSVSILPPGHGLIILGSCISYNSRTLASNFIFPNPLPSESDVQHGQWVGNLPVTDVSNKFRSLVYKTKRRGNSFVHHSTGYDQLFLPVITTYYQSIQFLEPV